MKISDLDVGSKLLFGALLDGPYAGVMDLAWKKVDPNNTFLTEGSVGRMIMDMQEPDNSSRDRRERGSNFFPQSSLLQWLCASGNDWFVKAHEADVEPPYADRQGFLTEFVQHELDAIEPHEICTVVPDGFRREFGIIHKMMCKVSIPAYSELFARADPTQRQEGRVFSIFENGGERPTCFTRTAMSSTVMCVNHGTEVITRAANQRYYVTAKVCIKGDTPVSETPDDNGFYHILPPDGNESCVDVSELFGVLAQ